MINPTRTTILLALLGSATGQRIRAHVHGVGADYFEADLHTFKCHVVPTDGSDEFFTGCTRDQAHSLGDSREPVTLELGLRAETADFTQAALEATLGIEHPTTTIVNVTGKGGRRERKQVPDGARSNLVMLINYVGMPVTYANEASARIMMQNPSGMDVDELYQATSYGRQYWPESETTVITIDSPETDTDLGGTCSFMAMSQRTDLLVATQHPNINLNDFIHKSYLIPNQVRGCGWGGVAYVNTCANGAAAYCKAWIRTSSATVLAHELGHNLGTIHAADDYDDDGHQGAEYGDYGCVMGRADWTSMNAPHRELLGYLGDGNGAETYDMSCAAQSESDVSVTISRLDLAPGSSNPNPNMVRIARFPSSNYLLSFKALADWDGSTIEPGWENRLHIHNHDGSRVNTMIVEGLANGETFTGAANRDGSSVPLTITVTDISTDTITVTINTDCGTASPTRAGQTYSPTPSPSDPENFRGELVCGETVDGTTTLPGNSMMGNPAADHYWHFSVVQSTVVTFDACASQYDTWIRVMNRGMTSEVAGCDDCGSCSSSTRTRLAVTLEAGDYSVVMEGYSDSEGTYSMTVECPNTEPTSPPNNPPTTTPPTTNPPTTMPPTTNPPTTTPPTNNPPTTSEPTNNPPTTMPPTNNPPTTMPPTTNPPTTMPPTNNPPTTMPPTNNLPTTMPPTTNPPTTMPPTTNPPTTMPPTTNPPTTSEPTNNPPTTTPPTCTDASASCVIWSDLGFCLSDEHDQYMHTSCRASCGLCDDVMLTPPPNEDEVTDAPTSPPPTNPPTSNPTTNAPTAPLVLCHFTECGNAGRCSSETAGCDVHSTLHEVRCCSDEAIPGWANKGGACAAVWGESDDTLQGWGCTSRATFDEAEAICDGVGARLCTVQELQDSCTRGTGCGHDNDLIWSSNEGVFGQQTARSNMLAEAPGAETTSDEPGIETTTTAQQDAGVDLSASSDADSSNGSSNGGAIAAAIIGTILVVGVIAAILYVRQQKQTAKQLEDGNSRHLSNRGISTNPAALIPTAEEEEVFQVATDGQSIRLESVRRGNPMYRNSAVLPTTVRSSSYSDTLESTN